MFDLMGVALYHGWLVDPQTPCHRVVKELSYNQLVEMIINNTASEDSNLVEEGNAKCDAQAVGTIYECGTRVCMYV